MDDEPNLRERSAKGERAQRLLEDSLIADAIAGERDEILKLLANARSDQERLEAQARLLALNALPTHLKRAVDDGKMARHYLNDLGRKLRIVS